MLRTAALTLAPQTAAGEHPAPALRTHQVVGYMVTIMAFSGYSALKAAAPRAEPAGFRARARFKRAGRGCEPGRGSGR